MICSSVNRFFMSNLLDGGIGLQSHVLLNSGGTSSAFASKENLQLVDSWHLAKTQASEQNLERPSCKLK
ncbi:MAG: hypothetical protein CVU33_05570 [Betaproteobacteria bacterium HGW-Betaproteobacteria-6]|nr:MAG: hypothetical protein CVU33_05570 [Betaproteobacteria bacterium HGW-Betaproteobacteria-6]